GGAQRCGELDVAKHYPEFAGGVMEVASARPDDDEHRDVKVVAAELCHPRAWRCATFNEVVAEFNAIRAAVPGCECRLQCVYTGFDQDGWGSGVVGHVRAG